MDALAATVRAVEEKFGKYLYQMEWLNLGGGHHITREDYDVDGLIALIRYIQERYGLHVYLEPGEAVALNAGFLVTEVLETVRSGSVDNAILDTSAACHMPDVLEMPYRPPLCGRRGRLAGRHILQAWRTDLPCGRHHRRLFF